MGPAGIDFDFARYVAYRRGQVEQRARDGAAYSYAGERKLRRALASARPVELAIEATTRLWKSRARRELMGRAQKATDQVHPRLFQSGQAAAAALGLEPPAIYVPEGDFPAPAAALGTDEDAVVVVRQSTLDRLGDRELVALVGHELGHIQNNQVLYATALFYLRHEALFFVRWIVQPAIMALQSWSRRAEITCDRAALIAVRDLDTTLAAMLKVELGDKASPAGDGGEAIRAQLAELTAARKGVGGVVDLFRSYPSLPKRARALEIFARSVLYKKLLGEDPGGALTADEVETQTADALRLLG